MCHPAVFLVISWLVHMHSWRSAHLKPWTAQDVITPCSSHSRLTDPDSFVLWKNLGSGAHSSVVGVGGWRGEGEGGTTRLPTHLSYAVLPSRPTEYRRCMLVACGTSQVNRSWSAGTSTPEAYSTASLIDLRCPLTTFTELSAAPLDCGPPSADVSCTTSPVQANFTALSTILPKTFSVLIPAARKI